MLDGAEEAFCLITARHLANSRLKLVSKDLDAIASRYEKREGDMVTIDVQTQIATKPVTLLGYLFRKHILGYAEVQTI